MISTSPPRTRASARLGRTIERQLPNPAPTASSPVVAHDVSVMGRRRWPFLVRPPGARDRELHVIEPFAQVPHHVPDLLLLQRIGALLGADGVVLERGPSFH